MLFENPVMSEDELFDWFVTHRVVTESERLWLKQIRVSLLIHYTYSYGPRDLTDIVSKFAAWLFLIDDAYNENGYPDDPKALREQFRRFDALFNGDLNGAPDNPFGNSIADVFQAANHVAPKQWLLRFGHSIRSFFHGGELESAIRSQTMPLSIESYMTVREKSVGVYPMLDLIELTHGAYLTEAESISPEILALRKAAGLISGFDNDHYSARKEALEERPFNAIFIYQKQKKISYAAAINDMLELKQRYVDELALFTEICLRKPSDAVRKFVEGVNIWVTGNTRWSSESPRYNYEISLPAYRKPPSAPRFSNGHG
jgi:hypothetical protein